MSFKMIKKNMFSLVLSLTAMITVSCSNEQATTETKQQPIGNFYGEEFQLQPTFAVHQLEDSVANEGSYQGTFEGKVVKNCKVKGCWMTMDAGSKEIRVTFKDYGFFVPLESAGSQAIVKGRAYYDTTSVDVLRHYAQDEGASEEEILAINEPKIELVVVADGVYMENAN